MRSDVALLNSAASSRPRSIAATISPPGNAFTAAPMPWNTSIEMPTVRNLRPLKSSGLVICFLYQPLGWYKKQITKPDDFNGLKIRTVGTTIDVFQGTGAPGNELPAGQNGPAPHRW